MEGGVGAFTAELGKALHALGHTIWIYTSNRAKPIDRPISANELRDGLDIGYATLLPRARHWRWGDIDRLADYALRYDWQVINIQYQAAAYNMRWPAIHFAPHRLRGLAKTVVTFHDLRVPFLFPKAGALRTWVVRQLAQRADGVICTNSADFSQALIWQPHLRQIPIGSNVTAHPVSNAQRDDVRQQLGLRESDTLLGYFGFLNPSKGADDLLAALAQLPPHVHLLFLGGQAGASDPTTNNQFAQQLHAFIAQHALAPRVHWSGFLPDPALSAHFSACDIVVLPYKDGVSLRRGTLMAAIAHGCPIITTTPPSAEPDLPLDTFFLVPPSDPAALASAVSQLQHDFILRADLGAQAHRLTQRFRWDKIAQQSAEFYATLATQ